MKIYGYAIEFKEMDRWDQYWNYKIYKSVEIAEEAIKAINWDKEFRIIELYTK